MKTPQDLIGNSPLVRYLVMGSMAFAVDYGLLVVTYYVFSFPLGVATSIGYVTGLLVSFLANRYWVFGKNAAEKHVLHQSVEYGILLVVNYFVTVLGIKLLNEHGIKPYVGKVLIMCLIVCWNYVLFKKVIFVRRQKPSEETTS